MSRYIQQEIGRAKDGKPVIAVIPKPAHSKENESEYRTDKRIQELARRGYNSNNIKYMIGHNVITEKRVIKGMRAAGVRLDGKLT